MTQRRELTEAQEAMLEHFAYLNYSERRPASWQDFICFEVNDKQYRLKWGTIKNNFSYLKRIGRIKLEYKDINAYYILADCAMTRHQASVESGAIKRDLASLIQRMVFDAPAIHDIHLRFYCHGLWNRLSEGSSSISAFSISSFSSSSFTLLSVRCVSKDLVVPTMILDARIKGGITVHKTDTVMVRLACSHYPIHFDNQGMFNLNSSLARIQERLRSLVFNLVDLTHPDTWTVVMWHIGRDSLERYNGEKFEIVWGKLTRVYSKEIEKSRKKYAVIRLEHQEYPNDALRAVVDEKLSQLSSQDHLDKLQKA